MTFGIKIYAYKSGAQFYYMTINDVQVFGVYMSEREVFAAIERVKRGEKP